MAVTEVSRKAVAQSKLPSWVWDAWRIGSSAIVTLLGLLALTFFMGRLLPSIR